MSETRVRYIGPPRSGIPEGRMGTLLEPVGDEISMVKWDPYVGTDCQVTHSGAATSDLEVVTSPPRCSRPTRPGMYLMSKPGVPPVLATITQELRQGLRVSYSISGHALDAIDPETTWWGPLETK